MNKISPHVLHKHQQSRAFEAGENFQIVNGIYGLLINLKQQPLTSYNLNDVVVMVIHLDK